MTNHSRHLRQRSIFFSFGKGKGVLDAGRETRRNSTGTSPADRQRARRRLLAERLEDRTLLAADTNPWYNDYFPLDVDGDLALSPRDALLVINELNRGGARQLLASSASSGEAEAPATSALTAGEARIDVNGDGYLAPMDALQVINGLNGEGEPNAVTFGMTATNLIDSAPITSVQVGDHFRLRTTVRDTRVQVTRDGVFAAYLDVAYSSQMRVVIRENQRIQINGDPTGGSFLLTFNGQTTAPITFDPDNGGPTALQVKSALEALNNIDPGEIEVFKTSLTSWEVKFGGKRYGNTNVPNMTGNGSALTGAVPGPATVSITELPGSVPGDPGQNASIIRSASFGDSYPNQRVAFDGEGTDPNVLDEIGAFSTSTELGSATFVLFTAEFEAIGPGTGMFTANPADVLPAHNVLLYGQNTAVPATDIIYPTLNVTISQAVNAVNDPANATEDQTTTTRINVLANDTTLNGQKFLTSFTQPGNGTVTRFTNGTSTTSDDQLDYRPNANFFGADTFTYVVSDAATGGNSGTAVVTVTVAGVNDAPTITGPNSVTTNEDTAFAFTGGNTVSVGDIDAGSGNLTVILTSTSSVLIDNSFAGLITGGANNSATMTLTGQLSQLNNALATLSYIPTPNASGSGQLVVNVNDNSNTGSGGAKSATKTVAVTITAVNDAPVNTVPAAQTATEGTPLVLSTANGNPISISDIDAGVGTLQVQLNIPAGSGTLALATTTGLSPVTGNNSNSISMTGTLTALNNALNGLTYNPPALFVNLIQLQIVTNDQGNTGSGGAKSDTDNLDINVVPNVRPRAVNDPTTVIEDSVNNVIPVRNNDIPNVGATIKLLSVSDPPHGTATVDNNGTPTDFSDDVVRYTPDPDYSGPDSFTYVINDTDGTGDDSTGTVSVTVTAVNDPPELTGDPADATEDIPIEILSLNLLSNDSPGAGETMTQTLTITAVSATSAKGGTVVLSSDKSKITYTPPADYNNAIGGPDTFTYTATDNGANPANLSGTATVTVNISAVNDNPIAGPDSATGVEDQPTTVTFATLLLNDHPGPATATDEAGQMLSVGSFTPLDGGTVTTSASDFVFTPAPHFNGPARVTYNLSDGAGGNATGTVTINVSERNDPPTANDDDVTAVKNVASTYPAATLLGNDSKGPANENGQILHISYVDAMSTQGGTVVLNPDGSVTYTPPLNVTGPDSFQYRATDNGTDGGDPAPLESNLATVDITILNFVPMTISGRVYFDLNDDGVEQTDEPGIQGVDVTLTGTDAVTSLPITPRTVTTDRDGNYSFDNVAPGNYQITEHQPSNTVDGQETAVLPLVVLGNDVLGLNITVQENVALPTQQLTGNNFGERSTTSAFAGTMASIELLASQSDPTSVLSSGIVFSYSDPSADDVDWVRFLRGWDGYLSADLDLAPDHESAVMTVVTATNQTLQTTVTTASARLRVRTDAAGNVVVHVVGLPSDFTFVQAGSGEGEQGEGEGPELHDAILLATRCRTDRATAEVIQAVDAALASDDFWA